MIMNNSQVITVEIYGTIVLSIIIVITIFVIINDLIQRQMYSACNRTLNNTHKINRLAVDKKTSDYLLRYHHDDLYRVNEYIAKKNDIIRYRLCLKKRSFDFYLKKQNLWKYKVLAIKMY